MYAYKSKLMPILELALKAKGKNKISDNDVNRIRELLQGSQEKNIIYKDLSNAPIWIKKIIKHTFFLLTYWIVLFIKLII